MIAIYIVAKWKGLPSQPRATFKELFSAGPPQAGACS